MEDYHDDIRSMIKSKRGSKADRTAENERFFATVMKAEEKQAPPAPEDTPAPESPSVPEGAQGEEKGEEGLDTILDEIEELYGPEAAEMVMQILMEFEDEGPMDKSAIKKLYGGDADMDNPDNGYTAAVNADRDVRQQRFDIDGNRIDDKVMSNAPQAQMGAPRGFLSRFRDHFALRNANKDLAGYSDRLGNAAYRFAQGADGFRQKFAQFRADRAKAKWSKLMARANAAGNKGRQFDQQAQDIGERMEERTASPAGGPSA